MEMSERGEADEFQEEKSKIESMEMEEMLRVLG